MTLTDIAARSVGVLCVAIFAGAGVLSLASLYRDISGHWGQIMEPWRDMVDAAAARWRAIAVLFPVTNAASAKKAGSTLDTAEAGVHQTSEAL